MLQIQKFAVTVKTAITEADISSVNAQSRTALSADDVYLFSVRACDDLPDRDHERFTRPCLDALAGLFCGKTVLFDHVWSAGCQSARIYAAEVVDEGTSAFLRCKCYMLARPENENLIAAIEGGIIKEVSVGCAVSTATCSLCGKPYGTCPHRKGSQYEGQTCIVELDDPVDAYELSFVAVPAQRHAGVEKKRASVAMTLDEMVRAKARLNIEKNRFGG